jgi:enoyl-CoA hydratase/carnithine racemase
MPPGLRPAKVDQLSDPFDGGTPVSDAPILFEVESGIARVTLNRPDIGDAIDLSLVHALVGVAIRCQTDALIHCVVLTGADACFAQAVM